MNHPPSNGEKRNGATCFVDSGGLQDLPDESPFERFRLGLASFTHPIGVDIDLFCPTFHDEDGGMLWVQFYDISDPHGAKIDAI